MEDSLGAMDHGESRQVAARFGLTDRRFLAQIEVSGLRDARGAHYAVPQISVDHQEFCTRIHRNAQSCGANSIDAFKGQDYLVARLSREALKTSQLS